MAACRRLEKSNLEYACYVLRLQCPSIDTGFRCTISSCMEMNPQSLKQNPTFYIGSVRHRGSTSCHQYLGGTRSSQRLGVLLTIFLRQACSSCSLGSSRHQRHNRQSSISLLGNCCHLLSNTYSKNTCQDLLTGQVTATEQMSEVTQLHALAFPEPRCKQPVQPSTIRAAQQKARCECA